jgi:hypothetical protein
MAHLRMPGKMAIKGDEGFTPCPGPGGMAVSIKHAAVAKQLEMRSLGSGEKENADNGHGVY